MLKRFDRRRVTVEGLDGDLRGWADVEGVRVRIPGALPGDEALVRIEAVSRHHPEAWAQLRGLDGDEHVADRAPACPHAWPLSGKCGGCPGLHVPYALQLQAKEQSLGEALSPLGVEHAWKIRPSPRTVGWRNRTNHVVQRRTGGEIRLGSRAPRSSDFAPMDGCLAVRPALAEVAAGLVDVLGPAEGLRYVSLRANRRGEVLVELIARDLDTEWTPRIAEAILALPAVVGVAGSENRSAGNAVRTAPAHTLTGSASIEERFGDTPAHVTADAFLQLNPEVAEEIYAEVALQSAQAKAERIVDLYCGVGPLGLAAAQATGASLVGVEVHPGARELATRAAEDVAVDARFVTASLEDEVPEGLLEGADVITVNPPRRGLDGPVLESLADLPRGPLVLYMSCNPTSFLRDVTALNDAGWAMEDLQAWDMLPNTPHVEMLARLTR